MNLKFHLFDNNSFIQEIPGAHKKFNIGKNEIAPPYGKFDVLFRFLCHDSSYITKPHL